MSDRENDAASPDDRDDSFEDWSRALESALEKAMPEADRREGYGTLISYALGGPDPLRYVWTIPRESPEPHWLYVSKGLSDPSLDTGLGEASGFGFEFALRVPRDPSSGERLAPSAFVVMLQSLARYVFESGNVFVDGDYLQLASDETTLGGLTGVGFVRDAELAPLATIDGTIEFRAIVGLTGDELDAIKTWSTYGFIDAAVAAGKISSNGITHPGRASLLADAAFAQTIAEGGAREGSRTGHLFTQSLAVDTKTRLFRPALTTIFAGADDLRQVLAVLPNRIAFERALTLSGSGIRVRIEPADAPIVEGPPSNLRLGLPLAVVRDLSAAMGGGARRYEVPGVPLAFEIR